MARKKARKKRIPIALFLSVVAHASLVLTLIYFVRTQTIPKKGIISIDFIETARHDSSVPHFRPRATIKPSVLPSPAALPRPDQPAGDPEARARETDAYIQAVLDLINRRKTYPRESLDREEEGRVLIGVSIDADGKILEAHIEDPSPFQRLDNAALKTVHDILSFPPLPPVIEAPLHLHIPILFRLEGQQ